MKSKTNGPFWGLEMNYFLLTQFWWAGTGLEAYLGLPNCAGSLAQLTKLSDASSEPKTGQQGKSVKRRRRRGKQLDIKAGLIKLLGRIEAGSLNSDSFHNGDSKARNPNLKRSSMYVGVSKNGDNWQALINNGQGKKYIGTYATEKQAAIAYDLYAFAIQGLNHKTNFNYTADIVEAMIRSFFSNSEVFEPREFEEIIA